MKTILFKFHWFMSYFFLSLLSSYLRANRSFITFFLTHAILFQVSLIAHYKSNIIYLDGYMVQYHLEWTVHSYLSVGIDSRFIERPSSRTTNKILMSMINHCTLESDCWSQKALKLSQKFMNQSVYYVKLLSSFQPDYVYVSITV